MSLKRDEEWLFCDLVKFLFDFEENESSIVASFKLNRGHVGCPHLLGLIISKEICA